MAKTIKATQSSEPSELVNLLMQQAQQILGPLLQTPLSPFATGKKGNFPYYYQNPSNLEFNRKTYDWIASNLVAGKGPRQLDGLFTNLCIRALGSISYSLSTADQAALNQASRNAQVQQTALLQAWKTAFGDIPAKQGMLQPIDIITNTIATGWASPATDLLGMQASSNLRQLLNKAPASGMPILPVLANYLNALGSSLSLQNAVSMNNGYLAAALNNVQNPAVANGALQTDDGAILPDFSVATPLNDIVNGLANASQKVQMAMRVEHNSSSEYRVSVSGSASFIVPVLDFFTLGINGDASYFFDKVVSSQNSIEINIEFPGVTLVNFGPGDFNKSTGTKWYWMEPIIEAHLNGSNDVSGYKFSPDPQIDFGPAGPFGLLEGVVISSYPTITITVKGADYKSISQVFEQHASMSISFLGIPLGSVDESAYLASTSVSSSESEVVITLTPPQSGMAGSVGDERAWVLGVLPKYPVAGGDASVDRIAIARTLKKEYPYQLYLDNTGVTYCSRRRVKSHAEANQWIKRCLAAHPGTAMVKTWQSNRQTGTIWP